MAQRSLKNLVSDTMIYGMSSIVGRFLNYLLVPLYTYKIAAESGGYGIVTNVYALTALMLVMLTFGMETTFFYFANKYKQRSDTVFSTALLSVGGVAALFVVLLFCFITPIATWLGFSHHPEFLQMMGVVVALDAFQAILFALLRYQGRAWKFAFLKLLFIVCNIGLNLFIFLVAPGLKESHPALMSWYDPTYQVGYIFLVNLVCTASITLFFIPELRKLRYGVDWALLKEMLRYTWPLLLFGIAGILNQVADKICFRFIIPGVEGDVQLGIYGACSKIAMIMAMITQAFRYAYEPIVFAKSKDGDKKEYYSVAMKYFLIFTLLAYLCVIGYMPILERILGGDYREGMKVVPIVMAAEIMMGVYFNLSFWYKLIDKTIWGAWFSAAGCIVLLAVNYFFIPEYSYMACAWGGVAGYGTAMLLSYFIGQKKYPIDYKVGRLLFYVAVTAVLYAVMHFVTESMGDIPRMAINTLLILIYVGIVWKLELTPKKINN